MADTPQDANSQPGAFISERHRNPSAHMAQAPKANYTLAGTCAILATIIFCVLLAILYMDWQALMPA
ncbi:MAG: hypothetical protein H7831_18430 [Magnetococcus sp. WYHC-3]